MNKWTLSFALDDVLICGPGTLEIVLRDFTSRQTLPDDPLLPAFLGTLEQRQWSYQLEDGITLQLISTRDTASDMPEQHRPHVGNCVSWEVPAEFAEQLHSLPRVVQ